MQRQIHPDNSPISQAKALALAGGRLEEPLALALLESVIALSGEGLADFLALSREITLANFGRKVSLCAILNAKSGRCSEDCTFCAQSAHYRAEAPTHEFVDLETVLKAAEKMRSYGARRFSLVTSGLELSEADFAKLCQAIRELNSRGIIADSSCGVLSDERIEKLRQAGLNAYHHNLETSREYFPRICSTHAYELDVEALRQAKKAGLYLCCGGIFGIGESWADRLSLALTLRELQVDSVPVNFLRPIKGTPLAERPKLSPEEALKIIALLRFVLPKAQIRICGGREWVFGEADKLAPLRAGASGLMIGDYLTVPGSAVQSDLEGIARLGYEIDQDA